SHHHASYRNRHDDHAPHMHRCDGHDDHPAIQLNDAGCAFFDRSDLHAVASMNTVAMRQKV
ncbi:MAG: hypothetical protein VW292_09475, partial [Alphaproteobacteria bacterium]